MWWNEIYQRRNEENGMNAKKQKSKSRKKEDCIGGDE